MTKNCFMKLCKQFLILALLAQMSVAVQAQLQTQTVNPNASAQDRKRIERFEQQVKALQDILKIPGLSAVIIKEQNVLWAEGFGYADLKKRIPATPHTLYHIASLTKTFAATLIMQLVEQGKLNLDEPMSKYSGDFKDETVKIRHLLSHTSEGTPGEKYRYNGNRYNYLTAVLEKVTGKSFRQLIVETFLNPLEMKGSVPGHDVMDRADYWSGLLGQENLNRYQINLKSLAKPYRLYGDGEVIPVSYPPGGIGTAAGLLSNVMDMAKYDAAIDRHMFLKPLTQSEAWTPFVSNSGKRLPHGLGWFVEDYQGLRLIWHYGHWGTGFSATYLKVPEKNLSLILLANSESLSQGFYYTGGIETQPFACSFLRLFVFEEMMGRTLPDPVWSKSAGEFSSELSRLKKQTAGFAYDCELVSHRALMQRLKESRASGRRSANVNPKIYDAYVGQYQLNANLTLIVSKEDNKLLIGIPGDEEDELFPQSETKFFLKARDVEIKFLRDEHGQVSALEVEADGQMTRAKKIK